MLNFQPARIRLARLHVGTQVPTKLYIVRVDPSLQMHTHTHRYQCMPLYCAFCVYLTSGKSMQKGGGGIIKYSNSIFCHNIGGCTKTLVKGGGEFSPSPLPLNLPLLSRSRDVAMYRQCYSIRVPCMYTHIIK